MTNRTPRTVSLIAGGLAALGLAASPALAQGHGGGAHFGGGHGVAHSGGYGGRGYGYGGYGRGYGGYRGGYGWHGGYYGGWGGWGGLGLGLYFASLPLYYSTLWWEGIPYYYADNTYYVYDGAARQYITTAPPVGLQGQVGTNGPVTSESTGSVGTDLMAYPKSGQSTEQQSKDKYECHHWAVTQSGFDPTQGASAAANPSRRSDYMRAQAACLDGRGYSVK